MFPQTAPVLVATWRHITKKWSPKISQRKWVEDQKPAATDPPFKNTFRKRVTGFTKRDNVLSNSIMSLLTKFHCFLSSKDAIPLLGKRKKEDVCVHHIPMPSTITTISNSSALAGSVNASKCLRSGLDSSIVCRIFFMLEDQPLCCQHVRILIGQNQSATHWAKPHHNCSRSAHLGDVIFIKCTWTLYFS